MLNHSNPRHQNPLTRVLVLVCLTGCALVGALSVAHADNATDTCTSAGALTQIASGVYVRQGHHAAPFEADELANIGFIVGERCVAVIDSGTRLAEGEAIQCAIKAVTPLPVCYVILTHHHFDHVMGSKAFTTGGTDAPSFIAHAKLSASLQQSAEYYRTELAADPAQPLPEDHIVLPDQTVNPGEPMTVDLGGRTLSLVAHPPAHTNNDLTVFDDKTATLWLSDLLYIEHIPALDSGTGSINGWIEVMQTLSAMPAERAVPGHGPVSVEWPSGGQDTQRYLTTVRDEVRELIANNGSLKEAQKTVGQSEKDNWVLSDVHHERTVIRAFTDLEWE